MGLSFVLVLQLAGHNFSINFQVNYLLFCETNIGCCDIEKYQYIEIENSFDNIDYIGLIVKMRFSQHSCLPQQKQHENKVKTNIKRFICNSL